MFKKKEKAIVHFSSRSEHSSISSKSIPLNDSKLLDYLRYLYNQYGKLTIYHVSSTGDIDICTNDTQIFEETENRIYEIEKAIRDFVKGRAPEVEVYSVLVNGEIIGVFNNKSHADLQRKNVLSRGVESSDIIVKPILMNRFNQNK